MVNQQKMFKIELAAEEANALYTFLQRVDIKGGEAQMMAVLQMKVERATPVETKDTVVEDIQEIKTDEVIKKVEAKINQQPQK